MATDETEKNSKVLIVFFFYRVTNPAAVPGIPDGHCVSIWRVA